MGGGWKRHDDSTDYLVLGKTLTVAVVFDRLGQPGFKVMVGKRALKDKLPTQSAAKQVALAYAEKVLAECRRDLDAAQAELGHAQDDGPLS